MPAVADNPLFDLPPVFGGRARDLAARVEAALSRAVPVVRADSHGLVRLNFACFKDVNHLADVPPADVRAISKSARDREQAAPFGLFGDVCRGGLRLHANGREDNGPPLPT
jgi:hypothetical protein